MTFLFPLAMIFASALVGGVFGWWVATRERERGLGTIEILSPVRGGGIISVIPILSEAFLLRREHFSRHPGAGTVSRNGQLFLERRGDRLVAVPLGRNKIFFLSPWGDGSWTPIPPEGIDVSRGGGFFSLATTPTVMWVFRPRR